ncbi:MAG: hypothetical protein IPO19_21705 [Rhodoferax sp.]|nr:hypothetical protein [Rhodoferax sp.]
MACQQRPSADGGVGGQLGLAVFLSVQAVQVERRLVRAAQLALSITRSGTPNDPRWVATKEEILALMDQGIAINPHYRKIRRPRRD